MVKGETFEWL